MVGLAEQAEILDRRFAAIRPELEVVSSAPGRSSVAAGEDAVPVAGDQRSSQRWWDRPAGARGLVVEFPQADHAAYGRIAGQPAHRLGRQRAAELELPGRGATQAGQRVGAGRDDELRPGG